MQRINNLSEEVFIKSGAVHLQYWDWSFENQVAIYEQTYGVRIKIEKDEEVEAHGGFLVTVEGPYLAVFNCLFDVWADDGSTVEDCKIWCYQIIRQGIMKLGVQN